MPHPSRSSYAGADDPPPRLCGAVASLGHTHRLFCLLSAGRSDEGALHLVPLVSSHPLRIPYRYHPITLACTTGPHAQTNSDATVSDIVHLAMSATREPLDRPNSGSSAASRRGLSRFPIVCLLEDSMDSGPQVPVLRCACGLDFFKFEICRRCRGRRVFAQSTKHTAVFIRQVLFLLTITPHREHLCFQTACQASA